MPWVRLGGHWPERPLALGRGQSRQDLCSPSPLQGFIQELLEKLRGLRTEHVLRRTSPDSQEASLPGLESHQ